jgi:hypothetical protein
MNPKLTPFSTGRAVPFALLPSVALILALVGAGVAQPQAARFTTAAEVLDRYVQALGGPDAVKSVQSEMVRGEVDGTSRPGKMSFVYYAKPFKTLLHVTRPDGSEIFDGFDGKISWSVTPKGASIDKDTPIDAVRRDADLQYPLHQPDYFRELKLAGVIDFEGRPCYWLHGTTLWGKDNNQFYDVETGLLAGYRFQSDNGSGQNVIALFQDYKRFGGLLMPTKRISRTGDQSQTFTITSVSLEPLADSLFDPPQDVKKLLN